MLFTLATFAPLLTVAGAIRLAAFLVVHQSMGMLWFGVVARDFFVRAYLGSLEEYDRVMKNPQRKKQFEEAGKYGIIGSITGAILTWVLVSLLYSSSFFNVRTIPEAIHLAAFVELIMLANALMHNFWVGQSPNLVLVSEAYNVIVLTLDVLALFYIGQLGF